MLRYFNAFGPRQRPDMAFTKVVRALASGEPFDLYGDGEQSRGWTYVDDVVDATIRAMERGQRHVQRRRRRRGVAARGDRRCSSGSPAVTLDIREQPAVPGDQRRTNADTTRIRSELGWAPEVSLEDGLRAQWEWASARVGAQ